VIIHDTRFITTIYRDYCRRGVAGRSNRAALARLHVKVTAGSQAIDDIHIEVCDGEGPLIALGYHWLRGATVLWASALNAPLLDVNDREKTSDRFHAQLTRLLFRFCQRHGVIDHYGHIAGLQKGA